MRVTHRAIAGLAVVSGALGLAVSPASAADVRPQGWTVAQLDAMNTKCDTVNALKNNPEYANKGFTCGRLFPVTGFETFDGEPGRISVNHFNYTNGTMKYTQTWTHTVGSETSAGVSMEVKASFWGVVETSVKGGYTQTWSDESTVTKSTGFTVPRCSVRWLERSAELSKATGDLTFSFNTAYNTHTSKWEPLAQPHVVTFPGASFTAPTGHGSTYVAWRYLTDTEKARCMPAEGFSTFSADEDASFEGEGRMLLSQD